MHTFKVFYGASKPLTAVGKNQCNLLHFAEKYPGWHSYASDRATLAAIKGLVKRGSIEITNHNQFRIAI